MRQSVSQPCPHGTSLIVGLGNPGRIYRRNRHNVGFMTLDLLAAARGLEFSRRQAKASIADGRFKRHKLLLAKPQTFMNLAGESVGRLVRFYRVALPDLLVVCDDLDLPQGSLRLRPSGGSAGHKGLRSIFEHLDSQDFPRLRIGIGRPPGRMDPADYVLQDLVGEERMLMDIALARAVECIQAFLTQGIQTAMTSYNGSPDG
jgi:PTH1 family peptidyl-tRNA hydrolase